VVKIYNENETTLSIDDVTSDVNVISILEIQGIKFTSRNFQIDIELKQMMTLNTEVFFDNCLIKSNTLKSLEKTTTLEKIEPIEPINKNAPTEDIEKIEKIEKIENKGESVDQETRHEESLEKEVLQDVCNSKNEEHILSMQEEDLDDLKEFDITDISTLDSITLKKPNQVYYEIYREARKKAKLAKKDAILAFLEAKNIKKTYMLENIDDSDSDNDLENLSQCSDIDLDLEKQ
jgi:hypothetical protein